jgi:K+-transporting ATPase ATPase C chain
VQERIASLQASVPDNQAPIPIDLITASASGLDPHISLAAARYQIARVARHRHLNPISIQTLVDTHAELPWLGFLGEPKINVLTLNLALDQYAPH